MRREPEVFQVGLETKSHAAVFYKEHVEKQMALSSKVYMYPDPSVFSYHVIYGLIFT